jgi:two-component system NtrC family sensor kinase
MSRAISPSTTGRIVVVDDDDYVREVTEMVLAGAGHSVRATPNGLEALRWLEEEPWDLLILDLRMPEIDGPALYREVLTRWPRAAAHVLFVSGVAERPPDPPSTFRSCSSPSRWRSSWPPSRVS